MTNEELILKKLEILKQKKHELEDISNQQDTTQHALKIFLNSAYGAFGSVYYPCFDLDNAEAITSSGRAAITEMVTYVNGLMNKLQDTENDQFVIAGDTDSVSADSIITIDNKTIEDLFNKYKNILPVVIKQNGTEYIDLNKDEYTYSQNSKTKIKTISRHKVNKPKWKITIDNDSVEMTSDHSIMVYRDNKIIECKPSEILQTDYLLKRKINYG